ncbi:hypothetical protein RTG_01968 [Rhodotorula toruloides ATCC 204091]|uniref:Complex 1 LYR protein n=1 Tax=Rhodotorula toruloides TaxID=5286 RepID=A0A0K3CC77_RHOTO|nr:hypothetical protein RTG_01968 [Rhodotorula toruloides ATCC 204091]KAK4334856.1 hypothetical protein RTBOTA2_003620 [Rhodotorula toruloides]PRQ76261.1 hypothetical protein AAT19DRAFT_13283 [Rhodotorula toruloides]
MATLPQLYRSTLRQFVKNSIHPRSARSPSIPAHLRVLFESGRTIEAGSAAASKFERDVENMVVFLRARRIHKELVDRYNPTHDMSQAERIEATAHRVGLQGPVEYDASNPRPLPMEGETEGEQGKEQEDGKGSLQTMFAPQH